MFTCLSYAETGLYVAIKDNEPQGVTTVSKDTLSNWEKYYTMIEVDDSFTDKQFYEIKYDGSEVRLATQQEIDEHLQQQEQAQKLKKKQEAMEILEISQKNLDKLKNLN